MLNLVQALKVVALPVKHLKKKMFPTTTILQKMKEAKRRTRRIHRQKGRRTKFLKKKG